MQVPSIIPAFKYKDAHAAIEFLIKAFGFERHEIFGDENTVEHAQLVYDGAMIMLGSKGREGDVFSELGPASVYVIVDNVEAHHQRAVEAGAEIVLPVTEQPYGGSSYTAHDPEGNVWTFGDYRPK